jgi:hypothetical protein
MASLRRATCLATQRLNDREGAHQLGLERRSEVLAVVEHDAGDGHGVAGIALAGTMPAAIALRAPSRYVEHLVTGGRQGAAQQLPIAGTVLDADDRARGLACAEPRAQLTHAGCRVGKREPAEHDTALVDESGAMRALVDVDADDHGLPPAI